MKKGYSSWERRHYDIPETGAERMVLLERLDWSNFYLQFCMRGGHSYAQYVRDTIIERSCFPDDFGKPGDTYGT